MKTEENDGMAFDPLAKRLQTNAMAADLFRAKPGVDGMGGVVMSYVTGNPCRWWCDGIRAMPTQRQRRDGVVTGQVFHGGKLHPCRIEHFTLEDGTGASCILRAIAEPPVAMVETFVAPWPLASHSDALFWRSQGFHHEKVKRGNVAKRIAKIVGWKGSEGAAMALRVRDLMDKLGEDKWGFKEHEPAIARAWNALEGRVKFPFGQTVGTWRGYMLGHEDKPAGG